jgi:phosphoribosyl 1,2-cyclic phosphodiesterase
MRELGYRLVREPVREVTVLLSHMHVDHIFGFPFFLPLYAPGWKLRVAVPAFSDHEARERLGRYLNGTFHPTRLRDVPAEVSFSAVRPGRDFDVGGFSVRPVRLNHPGGAVGYRIDVGDSSMVYVTDTAPFARPGEGVKAGEAPSSAEARVLEVLQGADTVVYDTMYDYDEYLEKMTWGHSYPEYAISLCRHAGVRRLVLFHHLPDASDDMIDERAASFADVEGIEVSVAREGVTLSVGSSASVSPSTVSVS